MATAVILEIRTYLFEPSSGAEFARLLSQEVLSLLTRHGLTVVGQWRLAGPADGAEHADLTRASGRWPPG